MADTNLIELLVCNDAESEQTAILWGFARNGMLQNQVKSPNISINVTNDLAVDYMALLKAVAAQPLRIEWVEFRISNKIFPNREIKSLRIYTISLYHTCTLGINHWFCLDKEPLIITREYFSDKQDFSLNGLNFWEIKMLPKQQIKVEIKLKKT